MDTMLFLKHRKQSMLGSALVSADPKALIHLIKTDKAHLDGSIKPWTVIHSLRGKD